MVWLFINFTSISLMKQGSKYHLKSEIAEIVHYDDTGNMAYFTCKVLEEFKDKMNSKSDGIKMT